MSGFLSSALWGANILGIFDIYLMRRQLVAYNPNRQLPPSICALGISNDENFRKSQLYNFDKTLFSLCAKIKDLIETNVVLFTQLLPKLWYSTQKFLGFAAAGSFAHCLAFQTLLDGLEVVINLPQQIYFTFVLEAKHGFNEISPLEFAKDKLKMFLLKTCLVNPVMVAMINFIIRRCGVTFPMYLFGTSSLLATLFVYIFPVVIQPLFNKFTPLEDGATLYKKISQLASSVGFPLTEVYVIDASKRSTHSNAYFYGFFNSKRIVFFDTLLKQLSDEEILAVLSHELGHWHHNHTTIMFIAGLCQIAMFSFALRSSIFNSAMYRDFGFKEVSPFIGVSLFTISYFETLATILHFVMTVVSRACEFQADSYAVTLGQKSNLRCGLIKLHVENLSPLIPDPLYASLRCSHPPLVERLDNL